MTDREILEKAISLAIDGGWKKTDEVDILKILGNNAFERPTAFFELIFDKDFAKALWGEDQSFDYYKTSTEGLVQAIPKSHPVLGYQHHLQQMVIADKPIKYLGDNI